MNLSKRSPNSAENLHTENFKMEGEKTPGKGKRPSYFRSKTQLRYQHLTLDFFFFSFDRKTTTGLPCAKKDHENLEGLKSSLEASTKHCPTITYKRFQVIWKSDGLN